MSGTPDIEGLKAHFEQQVAHYNARRMEEYFSDLADSVVYVVSPTVMRSGKAAVVNHYRALVDRFESWHWEHDFEYRVTGCTAIATGPFTQVSVERDGKQVTHSGVTMVVFTYSEDGWRRVAESMRFTQQPSKS